MSSGHLFWILAVAFGATACLGGQSGTEGDPDPGPLCEATSPQAMGLDDVTSLGTARALFDRLRAPQLAALSWYPQDGSSARFDTTLTLSMTGQPETASYIAMQAESCQPALQVTGGALRFETADGAFQESFAGVVSHSNTADWFEATLPVSAFAGTYDSVGAGQTRRNSEFFLYTSLSPARGSLSMSGETEQSGELNAAALIADWRAADNGGS